MKKRLIDRLDLSDKCRVFAVGDIHGYFDLLEDELERVEFDGDKDFLISVGDLVDRGPKSHEAIEWCQKPWFQHIIGNHEEFCEFHLDGDAYWHIQNGGRWFAELGSQEEKKRHRDILLDAPYLLEVITPGNRYVGFVHADLNTDHWKGAIAFPHFETFCWSRSRIQHTKEWVPERFQIEGLDWLIMGHTPVQNVVPNHKEPIKKGNCVWIDTGSFFSHHLRVIDIDKDIENIKTLA